ncbi:MAG: response regulator transcription factor [Treponemataceae bacterium]
MSERILVVEDDKSLSILIKDYLELSNYEVITAADGTEGLRLAIEGDFDLLLLDLMLPGKTGFEICREFREKSDKPVLILSARSEDIDKIRALGLGADDYVTKPFSPGELVARVKAHLGRYRRLTGTLAAKQEKGIEIRGLRLEPDTKRVFAREAEIDLTATEFDLLRLLMENPGRVFSREEIFSRIRGAESFGDTSMVSVHVRRIREKIERDPSEPDFLETVWGMGYRIRA